jgi:hypothetical protein
MIKRSWGQSPIEADNGVGSSEPFLYFPQIAAYPDLPGDRLVLRCQPSGGRRRHLIAATAWASTKDPDAPLYAHAAVLAQLGIRPGLAAADRANVEYREARWIDVLLWGDKVAISVAVAVLTLISTGLGAYVTYADHPKGPSSVITFWVLVVASVAAIINVFQQFLD